MVVGVDFDNTMICYDRLFHQIAVQQGLIPSSVLATKRDVRDYLRQQEREEAWIELQGYAYGARIQEATPFPGVREFFARCHRQGVRVLIISHKTRRPFQGPDYDLHEAAHRWLADRGFYDPAKGGLSRDRVWFELTKQEKLDRIASAGCEYFIDDLPEFLAEPGFPLQVKPVLFDPNDQHGGEPRFLRLTSWMDIEGLVFGMTVVR